MQVQVFMSTVDGNMGRAPRLLVLPAASDASMPAGFRSEEWTFVATTTTDDKLLGATAAAIEAEIAGKGYAVVHAVG